eukprot:TRINITY_DN170_c0_g1_i2.p1 TRINITY_DN170_c0_g1~~TRINITY_DN170_c0_g1_i2.p1  ORF type:complete len:416 (-),score=78.37 TRINITY_DN170_c0_g1_i2:63-1277(-)
MFENRKKKLSTIPWEPTRRLSETDEKLLGAVRENRVGDVKSLIQAKADVNAKDFVFGRSALAWAASAEVASLLLQAGAQVETKDFEGYTPLTYAVIRRAEDLVKLFVAKGCNHHEKDISGLTVHDWVKETHNAALGAILGVTVEPAKPLEEPKGHEEKPKVQDTKPKGQEAKPKGQEAKAKPQEAKAKPQEAKNQEAKKPQEAKAKPQEAKKGQEGKPKAEEKPKAQEKSKGQGGKPAAPVTSPYTLTLENVEDIFQAFPSPSEKIRFIAIDYHWGPPISGRFDTDFMQIWVAVASQTQPKSVQVHGRAHGESEWTVDLPLSFVKALSPAYDLYYLRTEWGLPVEFVLKLVSQDGSVHYDNNGGYGQNYLLNRCGGRYTSAHVGHDHIQVYKEFVNCWIVKKRT